MSARIIQGDAAEKLRELDAESAHAIVTDPPAGIGFMGKAWDGDRGGRNQWIDWITGIMVEALRVLKPGGACFVWALPRTSHWTATAIEDAGFEIRDVLTHHFGSGFPKSLDVSKAIDAAAPRVGMFDAFAKHFAECRAASGKTQKEIAVFFPSKTGGVTGCVWNWENALNVPTKKQWVILSPMLGLSDEWLPLIERAEAEREQIGTHEGDMGGLAGQRLGESGGAITANATDAAKQWDGWGTALKPATEHWILARKPLTGTVAANVMEHGTGGLNIDGSRVKYSENEPYDIDSTCRPNTRGEIKPKAVDGTPERAAVNVSTIGRWPPNLLLSHSALCDDAACRPCCPVRIIGEQSGALSTHGGGTCFGIGFDSTAGEKRRIPKGDTGTAARFFPTFRYEPKPSTAEREAGVGRLGSKQRENSHPTVKPVALMQWLCRLIAPPGGTVLDPFCGSGSTGIAASREGFSFVGIEKDPKYVEIAKARIVGDAPLLNTCKEIT